MTYWAQGARSPAEAIAMFDADPDGNLKTHPDDPTIPFDGITVYPMSQGAGFKVTARFSTIRSGRLAAGPPVDEPGWHSWERGKRRGDGELAYNRREWRIPDTGDTEPYQVWVLDKVKTPEIYPQRTLRFRVTTGDQGIFDIIDDSIGDIHKMPNDQYWQLVDSETRPVDGETWEVSYTWERDRGTGYPDPIAGDSWQVASYDVTDIPIPYDPGELWRPPYCKVLVPIIPLDPRTEPFMVVIGLADRAKLNPDGWQTLPGSELI